MTSAQCQVLTELALDGAPHYVRAEVYRAFVALTGLPITRRAVGRFMTESLGLPKIAPAAHVDAMARIEARGYRSGRVG